MNYLELLENSYKMIEEYESIEKFEYLAEYIFGFTTYENEISSLMAKKCLEVCRSVSEKKTFEYIKLEDGELWYLIMVNMPFFSGKLEWGTSIRGAWWDLYGNDEFTIDTCGLFDGDEQVLSIDFNEENWNLFIKAMIDFSGTDH